MIYLWCNLHIHFAGCNLKVTKIIISRTVSYTQYQLDKTEKTNKQTRKQIIIQETIKSAQYNGCNLVFYCRIVFKSLIIWYLFVWSKFLACKTLPTLLWNKQY